MIARFFESLIDPLEARPVQKPPATTREFFSYHLRPYRKLIVIALAIGGVASVSEILLYVFLGQLVDWMAYTERADFFSEHGIALVLMLITVVIIRPLSSLSSRAMMNLALAPGIANAIRWQNHRYVMRQSLSFFQNDFAGRVAQKVMQTGNSLREALFNVVDGVWFLVIYLVGIVIYFSGTDQELLLPVLLWIVGYLLVIFTMVKPVQKKSRQLSEATSVLTGRIVDSYTNIQSVKLFAHAEQEESYAADGIARHTSAFRIMMRAVLSMTVALTVLNTLLVVATAGLSIVLWQQGKVSVGDIAVVNGLVIRLSQMSGWILRTVTSLFENIGAVENGMETISQNTLVLDSPDATTLDVTRGAIEFRQVNFNYASETTVINNCNLSVKPGERVGLVGRSGAGKSTLVNLLLRFYDIDSGEILIDGQNLSQVTQHSLRSNIGVVTQDTSLLHRSIRDNIAYGRQAAEQADVIAAARTASADVFIDDLKDMHGRHGYEALVGERGVKLSGGQRQRIAIARVILKNAPILVLDEATSSLDSEVEQAIQEQLYRLMEGKTVLAVAHRLSTIAALDRLVVLDAGRIVEQGSHEDLLNSQGLYASLWQRQSGGFLGQS